MAELQTPNPAVLKKRQAPDDDLESQRPSMILTKRREVFNREQPK